ncbi:MAG: glycosyltransferase N-terminal domain-containing protein [Planctomycetota bacterium]|nr:glycosyltransferase N-terminal domain-containing protein [Planctomycetota bacterium]
MPRALDILYLPIALAYLPSLLRKKRGGWPERFGRVEPLPPRSGRIMLHAVSVGEVNALRPLVPRLLATRAASGGDVLVTSTTDTGLARAQSLYMPDSHVRRYPLDLSASVDCFLDSTGPAGVALTELEIWPNFVSECQRRSIPVAVINGRLSPRSFKGYVRIRRVMRRFFASLAFAAVQDEAYAERFRAMGVAPSKLFVTGSMKWDSIQPRDPGSPLEPALASAAEDLATSMGIDRSKPLVVAGSTGPEEESLLHEAVGDSAQLLCAPRKPERFDEAALALPGCVRRSATRAQGHSTAAQVQSAHAGRFLLDTIGELRAAYALADVVVVGRSFFNLHGSDPIEPIALGKPTIIGPAFSDFTSVVAALQSAGALLVCPRGELKSTLHALLASPARRAELAAAGAPCIRAHQGAAARHADLIERALLYPA